MTTRQFEENMLTGLKRLFVRNKRRSNRPSRKPVLGMESLQKRELLAADLIGTHFNADEPLQWGDSFNVDGVIENDGNQSARSSYLRFYLSNNSNINTDDVFLGWKYIPSIAAGREHRFDNHQLRLPTSPPSGFTDIDNVHVGMIVDGYDYVGEGWWGERNNRNRGTGRDRDSLQVSPALRSPTLNSATATSSTEVRLNWSNVQNEDGYKVYQWHNGRQVVNHVGRNSTSYSARNLNPDATYYFRVAAYSGSVEKSSGWMEVRTPAAQTNDPNDQISEAPRSNYLGHLGDGRSGGLFRFEGGVIDSPTDVDMFAMDVAAGQRISIDIDRTDNQFDSYLRIFDSNGRQLAANDDGAAPGESRHNLESHIEHTFQTAGRYYIGVSGYRNSGYDPRTGEGDRDGRTGRYDITVQVSMLAPLQRLNRNGYWGYMHRTTRGGYSIAEGYYSAGVDPRIGTPRVNSGNSFLHNGVDFAPLDLQNPMATRVVAPESGTITLSQTSDSVGYWVILQGDSGIEHILAHLDRDDGNVVRRNARVSAGQYLGRLAPSTRDGDASDAPHLHYGTRLDDRYFDPAVLFPALRW